MLASGASVASGFVLALVLSAGIPSVAAWGHDGHVFVCAIAQGLLSDAAAAKVQELLPPWAAGYFPTVCPWADYIGHSSAAWHWSLPLHYIDTPDNLCAYDYSRDCRGKCVVAAILNYTGQLNPIPTKQSTTILKSSSLLSPTPPSIHSLTARVKAQAASFNAISSDSLLRAVPSLSLILNGLPHHPQQTQLPGEKGEELLNKGEKEELVHNGAGEEVSGKVEGEVDEREIQKAAVAAIEYLKSIGGDKPSGSDPDPSVLDPTVALMFLAHFVGDIHQPLHVGFTSDYGGNRIKVQWYSKKTNLHEVWDTEIIKHGVWKYHSNTPSDFLLSLAKRLSGEWAPLIAGWATCGLGPVCPNTFAGESIGDACKWAYNGAPTGSKLEDPYFESRFPVVEMELAKAGVRLAATLNRIFGAKDQPASAI